MEHWFTFISLGFNGCCSLYFLLRFIHSWAAYYLCIAFVGIMQSTYMLFSFPGFLALFEAGIHPVLLQVSSVGLSAVVLSYYLFLLFFLDLANERVLRGVLVLGTAYMVAGILCKMLRLHVPFAYALSTGFFIKYYIVIDALVMITLFLYVIRVRKKHLFYLFWAIVSGIVVAVVIHSTDHFGFAVSKYHVRQLEVVVSFVFFFLAIMQKEEEVRAESQRIREELLVKEISRRQEISEERDRIARDIHDEIGAGVSALKLQIELLGRKQRSNDAIDRDLQELLSASESINQSMREMLWTLKATDVDTGSFVAYVSDYCQQFLRKAGIRLHIHRSLADGGRPLAPAVTRNLFLCIKEALNNVYKHSQAEEVHLRAVQGDGFLEVTLKDDGVGLPTAGADGADSYGIANMRERMAAVDGLFSIRSEGGVEVSFRVGH